MATKKQTKTVSPKAKTAKAPAKKASAPAKKPAPAKPAPKKAAPKAPAKAAPAKKAVAKPAPKKAAPAAKKAPAKPVAKKPAAPAKPAAKKASAKPAPVAKKAPAPAKKPAPAKPAPAPEAQAPAKPAPKSPLPPPKMAKKFSKADLKRASAQADMYPPVVNVLPPPLPGDSPDRPKSLKPATKPFTQKELSVFRVQLEEYRAVVMGNLKSLAGDNLRQGAGDSNVALGSYSTHMADHGTDNFDRELALNLVSGQQDSIYDINDAIRRIDEGTFGICEQCGNAINPHRLRALPFARKCLACQSAEERGRTIYRPFGRTISQQGTDASGEDAPET